MLRTWLLRRNTRWILHLFRNFCPYIERKMEHVSVTFKCHTYDKAQLLTINHYNIPKWTLDISYLDQNNKYMYRYISNSKKKTTEDGSIQWQFPRPLCDEWRLLPVWIWKTADFEYSIAIGRFATTQFQTMPLGGQ